VARTRVALLSRIVGADEGALARLEADGVDVVIDLAQYETLTASADGEAAWRRLLATIDGLVVGLQTVDAALLDAAPHLRFVLRIGTGLDSIDVAAATARGVEVSALEGLNAPAVAEFAFSLLLAVAKRIPQIDSKVRAGGWERAMGLQLAGGTLGLVGFGSIARAVVPKALGFGMNVLVHREHPNAEDDAKYGVRSVGLEELIRESQFISLHAPLNDRTRHLIGPSQIDLMRGTVLINTARGGLVDEDALRAGLTDGRVAAAGLDVLAEEPPRDNPLIGMPNVVVTSHTAGYTDAVNSSIANAAADFMIARVS
jgi:phosphoglycerate dehydrogenase-like enzyme